MRKLAPLVVFVYNRVDLTRKTLEAINNNTLAGDTELFIYSDGPKNNEDLQKVLAVRQYIHRFSENNKFMSVTVTEAEKNKGLANSIISGVTEIIHKYGTVIVLEDDLVTAKNFLEFMNNCLFFYEKNEKIWSIGGTTYELPSFSEYKEDVYLCYRGESCGWATWLDRWSKVDWDVSDYKTFLKDRKRKEKFKRGGQDMVEALKMQMEGKTDSWAIRWCYQESKEDMLTVLPVKSLTENIGWDGSGTHSDVDRFHTKIHTKEFKYTLKDVEINDKLMNDFRGYFSKPLLQRMIDFLYVKLWRK